LAWTALDDAFIEFYKLRSNKNGTTDYFEVQSRETNVLISGLDITSNYDFRVQAENLLGVTSTGTTLSNQALNGDTTAPSAPTGGAATGGIQTITAEWTNPNDIDFKHVEVFVNTSDSIPASPTAVVDGEEYVVTGLSGAVTRYFWLKAVDFSGNKSAATASFNATSVVATTTDIGAGAVTTTEIGDDAVTVTKLANVLQSTNYVSGTTGWEITTAGNVEFSDGTFRGTLVVGGTTLSSSNTLNSNQSASDITTGTLDASSITVTNLSADSITAGTLNANRINIDGVTLDVDGSGQLIIANDGVGSAQIANGAVGLTEFASGLQPVQVVSTLPASASEGDMAYLTTDNKLYRYDGSAWIKAVDGADVTSGTLPAASIVANSITAGQISAGAINTDELAANAVTAAKISAGTITFDKLLGGVIENTTDTLASAVSISPSDGVVTIDSVTLGAPDDTTLGHKPLVIVKMEWNIIGSSNWDDDGGDLPEVRFIVNDQSGSSELGQIASFYYTHHSLNDTSVSYAKHTAEMIGFFNTAITAAKTFYIKGAVTNFDGQVSQDRITVTACDVIVAGIR